MENDYVIFDSSISSKNSVDDIGGKAFGLIQVNSELVPRFLVLKSSLFELWKSGKKQEARNILKQTFTKLDSFFKTDKIIIRSSASKENFHHRGHYASSPKSIHTKDFISATESLWKKNEPMINSESEQNFALIVQDYIEPAFFGHLSNERRFSKEKNRWIYEILISEDRLIDHGKLVAKKQQASEYINPNRKDLTNTLREIASIYSNERCHIEWVWDNSRIWIVQKDIEPKVINTHEPGINWKQREKIITEDDYTLESLKRIGEHKSKWKKVECVTTFKKIELPSGDVFIIEGENNLKQIEKGVFSKKLLNDLNWLLRSPIVVRMDINNANKHEFLLPRTESLFNIEDTKLFIVENVKNLLKQGIKHSEFCFLLHRFIVSKSCSLAFSKPDIPRTRIDSTWGIVDGLYYHPHDSFEYSSATSTTKKKIRCKTEFLDIDKKGNWVPQKCNDKLDWKASLTPKEIKTIAIYNEKITHYLGVPVTVMYFVGVFKGTGYPEILPWYYTTEEIPESSEKFSEVIFSEKKITITNREEFLKLKNDILNLKKTTKISIKLNLTPNLLRDREFLEEIGAFSATYQIPILLEGSILSHPYYILRKKNAIVKVRGFFDPSYDKQMFYKLVRDKIPIQIASKGESVKSLNITPAQYLELLKQKLVEEAFECFWEENSDNFVEELADVYEILRAASSIFNIKIKELESIADSKKQKKGGFERGIFLLETKEQSLIKIIDVDNSNIQFPDDQSVASNAHDSIIPKFNRSSYHNNTLFVPLIPSLRNQETNTRVEKITIDEKNEYIVHFTEKGVQITLRKRINPIDESQLTLDL